MELTVATQVLGPYLLTATLAPLLWRSSPATIVTVSSGGMYTQRFDLDHLQMAADDYDGVIAYARCKRAEVVLASAWARRFAAAGVASYAMHPGWVETPGLKAGLPRFEAFWRPLLRSSRRGCRHRCLARQRRTRRAGECPRDRDATFRVLPRSCAPA